MAVVALLTVSCRAAAPTPDSQTPGGRLYAANCSTCHGPAGQGVGDVPKIAGTTDILGGDYDRTVVTQGRNRMPAFGASLTQEQIREIIDYVATFKD
jgi:mono/diheme cytochrome c family protein